MTQKYQFVASHASQYPIRLICRVLGLVRSGYYAWRTRSESPRRQADRHLSVQIAASFRASRQSYGSPRVHADLHKGGVRCARKRVARLMRQAGLRASAPRRRVRTTDSHHHLAVAENLLKREFRATAPDLKWVADITYLPTQHGWVYLAAVLDLFSRRVIGWAVRPTLERELVVTALQRALVQRKPSPGLLHHSDRGSQYASCEYQQQLTAGGIRGSMSRKGNCWDNAPMESFFGTLKTELGDVVYADCAAASSAVFDYIERFYNRQRRHSALGYLTPVAYEQQFQRSQQAA